jgi:hypothetical protein
MGATLAAIAWAGTSHAQSVPRYPTPTPAPVSPTPPPDTSPAATPAPPLATGPEDAWATSGAGQSTTRSLGSGTATPTATGDADASQSQRSAANAKQTGTTTTTGAAYDPNASADTTRRGFRANRPLVIIGSSIFVGSYATTAVVGAVSDLPADRNLFIPVAGPWLDLSERPCGFGDCGTREDVNNALLVGGGITQAAGLALVLSSLFVPEREHAPKRAVAVETPKVRLAPVSLGRGGGLGAVGTF